MAEEIKKIETQETKVAEVKTSASKTPASGDKSKGRHDRSRGGSRGAGRGRGRGRRQQEVKEFEQKILELSRVTRVTAGGKRMSFRCALVIGDRKGRVGLGVAKGADVQISIEKAYRQAKKNVVTVPILNETIPHTVWVKYGAALVMLKPAPVGTGLKSGGAMRMILEFAGVPNVVTKIVNSNNKINIARATLEAIRQLRAVENKKTKVSKAEGKPVEAKEEKKEEEASAQKK